MKAVLISLCLAALVSAQQANITLIPSGISTDCNKFLVEMNNNAQLSACVAPLITATSSFNPLSGANLSTSDINWTLATMCKANTGCSDATIRTWLSRFYASCSPELTSPTAYNSQVRELYDILYVVNPLKGAVCSIDSANQQYCVNQVIGVGANSTGPSGNTTGSLSAAGSSVSSSAAFASTTAYAGVAASVSSAAAAGSAAASSASAASISLSASMSAASASASSAGLTLISGSAVPLASASSISSVSSASAASASASPSASLAANALFANFATSWSPVQFASDNLWIAYSGATAMTKRMIDLLPRQDASQSTLATVITPNATTYRSTNLPFLFLQPSFGAPKLCTPCTREIMVQYIKWETAVPYALGLAQSPILGGQMELWESIDKTCGSTYVAAINAQVGQFVGITNSSSSAMSVLAAPGGNGMGAVFSLAALVGAVAYMV